MHWLFCRSSDILTKYIYNFSIWFNSREKDAQKIMAQSELKQPHLTIIVVCGAPHSGKSTYIADVFGESPDDVIDMFQFQQYSSYPASMPYTVCCGISNMLVELAVKDSVSDIYSKERRRRTKCEANGEEYVPDDHLLIVEGTYLRKARRMSLRQTIENVTYGRDNVSVELAWVSRKGRDVEAFDYPDYKEEGFDEMYDIADYEPTHDMKELEKIVEARNKRDRVRESGYFSELPTYGPRPQMYFGRIQLSATKSEDAGDAR